MNKLNIKTKTRYVSHDVVGRNVVVNNRKIYVNGKLVESIPQEDGDEITINWEGDLADLDAVDVNVSGDVKGSVDGTNINISGNVGGDVDGVNVTAKEIHGKVDAVNVRGNIQM